MFWQVIVTYLHIYMFILDIYGNLDSIYYENTTLFFYIFCVVLQILTQFVNFFLTQYSEAIYNGFSTGWNYYPGTCFFNPWVRISVILVK